MSKNIVEVHNVSKVFKMHAETSLKGRIARIGKAGSGVHQFRALDNVNFDLPIGTTFGLVGHNGSGKSTLLKMIGGVFEPSSGSIRRRGRIAPLIELGAGFHPDLTGRENIYLNAAILGLKPVEIRKHFDSIVAFSEIEEFIDTQVKFYSSGMYVRLAFSIAIHVDPDLLLVDEVLAVGDLPFQRKCMDKIAEFQREGRTIALVSHSSEQIRALCEQVVVLEKGKQLYSGEVSEGLRILNSTYARNMQEHLTQPGAAPLVNFGEIIVQHHMHASTNTEISVQVECTASAVEHDWLLGVTIWFQGEQKLFAVTTEDLGVELPRDTISTHVKFEVSGLNLMNGDYSVSVGAILKDRTPLFSLNPAYTFTIADVESRGSGPLKANARVRFE